MLAPLLTPMLQKKLLIIASPSLLNQFQKLTGSEEALRNLLGVTIPDLKEEWFPSNYKLLIEGQRKGIWPAGFDCIDYPDMKFVAQDGHTVEYPIDVVPVAPDWVFIYSPKDPQSVPGKANDGILYVTEYPECLKGPMVWKPWQLTCRMGIQDGQHRGSVNL